MTEPTAAPHPVACMNCRARKLKCSGDRPSCTNCPLHGTTCEYATTRAKRGPPKGSTLKRKRKDPATATATNGYGNSEVPPSTVWAGVDFAQLAFDLAGLDNLDYAPPPMPTFDTPFILPFPTNSSSPPRIQLATPDARRVYRVHCWAPLFPLQVAHTVLRTPADNFCGAALRALVAVPDAAAPNAPHVNLDEEEHYAAAQQLAMPAYTAALAYQPEDSDGPVDWDDPRLLTAAGLAYLAVREVFVRGWCRDAATWLRLSAGVVESLPASSALRAWLMRVVWMWDVGMRLAATPYGPLRLAPAVSPALASAVLAQHQVTPDGVVASIGGLEGDARVFDTLVSLALDLSFGLMHGQPAEDLDEPLRVQEWLDTLPPSMMQGVLRMVTLPPDVERGVVVECDGRPAERQAMARVVQLIYYALCARCFHLANVPRSPHSGDGSIPGAQPKYPAALRVSSIRAAMANMLDTADWFLHTRHYWLWAFAEQGLVFVQNSALGRLNHGLAPTPEGEEDEEDEDEEESIARVVSVAARIPPDAPRHGVLLMIQDVLATALESFSAAGIGAGHMPRTRVLLTIAAAALSGANATTAPPLYFLPLKAEIEDGDLVAGKAVHSGQALRLDEEDLRIMRVRVLDRGFPG